jgi:hypothetical protein
MVTIVTDGEPDRAIAGTGTPESDWLRADVLGHLPLLDLDGCARAVILSPHPDDETLGLGGLIATSPCLPADWPSPSTAPGPNRREVRPRWRSTSSRTTRSFG